MKEYVLGNLGGPCPFLFISFIKILAHNPTMIQTLDHAGHSESLCLNVVEVFMNFWAQFNTADHLRDIM
jgi:hypothetical protein